MPPSAVADLRARIEAVFLTKRRQPVLRRGAHCYRTAHPLPEATPRPRPTARHRALAPTDCDMISRSLTESSARRPGPV